MSRFNLAKKLPPAKKAWKSFKATLQCKLHKLKNSKTIKTSQKYSLYALKSIRHAVLCGLQALTRSSRSRFHRNFHYYHHENMHIKGFRAIYIDELFPRNRIQSEYVHVRRAGHNGHGDSNAVPEPTGAKEMVASSSRVNGTRDYDDFGKQQEMGFQLMKRFQGVDERAEEFISKFRQEMKLERENSFLDFQDMLRRSA